jgi:low affinity Fe/Cu permease
MHDQPTTRMDALRAAFGRFAGATAHAAGSWWTFALAVLIVLGWVVGAFWIGFDNELWQLAINTATTIVTFLMVFLIQYAQNRDTEAIHLKLDELIRTSKASNDLLHIDELTVEEIEEIRKEQSPDEGSGTKAVRRVARTRKSPRRKSVS